jgi:lysophospholipase L1-like esterase
MPLGGRGRQMKRWTTIVVLLLGSIVASFLLAEVILRFFAPQPMSGSAFEYAPRGYMINKSSGKALFSVGDRAGTYHLMSPHLRGTKQPKAGTERILVLGDSFTFGVGLSEKETYVARLQQKIDSTFGPDQIVLLNAGIGGSGLAEQLAFLEDFGSDIAPRAVLVFVSIDDFSRAQRSPLYRLRDTDTFELDEGTLPISTLKELAVGSDAYNFAIQHFHIAQLMRRAAIGIIFTGPANTGGVSSAAENNGSTTQVSTDQRRLARALFRRMKAWCDSHGARLAVINNGWRRYDWLPQLLEAEGIPAFDATPQVQSVIRNDPSYIIPRDGHPNAKGAEVTAEAVWPFVERFVTGEPRL